MSQLPVSIPKQPALKPAEDYYLLRREGIGFIEQLGSRLWTDYNTHDPGITILEALCYAITELAYRTGWDIKDILAPDTSRSDQSQPYPDQAFFTAREILTVNPVTLADFRRLLIDLETGQRPRLDGIADRFWHLCNVRNAWVFCKECGCGVTYYAWCDKDQLKLAYQKPENTLLIATEVKPLGLYDVLLELESDPELGDLNDRKIEHTVFIKDVDGAHPIIMELRFPDVDLLSSDQWRLFLDSDDAFANRNGASFNLKLVRFGATKTYNVFADAGLDEKGRNSYVRDHWRNSFYLGLEIELVQAAKKIVIENAALRVFSDVTAKNAATAGGLKKVFEDTSADGFIQRYRKKAKAVNAAVASAKAALQAHRNLDEDYCCIKVVGIEEVAVCADVEVRPDADIERVQARIWFEIEQYFNPPVPFYTLQELQDAGKAVEEIFNGPKLESGFIRNNDLEAASLKSVLCVSDMINRLMDIDGVIAVNRLQMTKYDAEGNVISGAADPTWSDGKPHFEPKKISASWMLYVSKQHQPRLYLNASRFLFYKNGLPFLPCMDEVYDTLTQLRGEADRPKIKNAPKDLAVSPGKYRNPGDYYPVQYSFPLTYGIGTDGLPSNASDERKAQAMQLKAYLMVFEQVLGNAFEQVAHAADLFSLDPKMEHTYFVREFNKAVIQGYDEMVNGLDKSKLDAITETVPEFHERRNRFLNHIMARFGEQFGEYALLLTKLQGQQVALDSLIAGKISFIKDYPQISHDRGKAFNYKKEPCSPYNIPGLKKRISLLLGCPELRFIVVEHLLLRPKFPGDALYPACPDVPCRTCGDEDPYSFRLTFVMPGWTEPYKTNMDMRSFAEHTIRQETPSHLLGKICWVGNNGVISELDRFEDAWHKWLEANAAFDWTEERLHERVEAILASNLVTSADMEKSKKVVCECAAHILKQYGKDFYEWMNKNFKEGKALKDFRELQGFSSVVTPCRNNFLPAAAGQIKKLLKERYTEYVEVSYRLWIVVDLLSKLSNTYPAATLRDCDKGSDQNPMQLGETALGS